MQKIIAASNDDYDLAVICDDADHEDEPYETYKYSKLEVIDLWR